MLSLLHYYSLLLVSMVGNSLVASTLEDLPAVIDKLTTGIHSYHETILTIKNIDYNWIMEMAQLLVWLQPQIFYFNPNFLKDCIGRGQTWDIFAVVIFSLLTAAHLTIRLQTSFNVNNKCVCVHKHFLRSCQKRTYYVKFNNRIVI